MQSQGHRLVVSWSQRWLVGLLMLGWMLAGTGTVFGKGYTFSTLAGLAGNWGTNNGTGSAARFNYPCGLAVDSSGYLSVADDDNYTIRFITPSGAVTTYAGQAGVSGTNDGLLAKFGGPWGVAIGPDGYIYSTDSRNQTVRKTGGFPVLSTTTLAGQPGVTGTTNGTGSAAQFYNPYGIAVDSATNVYVADSANCVIRRITPAGVVTTLVGQMGVHGTNDGLAVNAQFNSPSGLAMATWGAIYVADMGNHTIREISWRAGTGYYVTTLAGQAGVAGTNDGIGTAAHFNFPIGIAVDYSGNLFVTDYGNHTIRKMTPVGTNWVVMTIGGAAGIPGSTDGSSKAARFNNPNGITIDNAGNLYVTDAANDTIRKATPPMFYLQDATGNVTQWAVNSGGVLQPSGPFANMGGWTLKALGDVTKDGNADLFWQLASGWVSVWLSTSSNNYNGVGLGNLGTWALDAVADVDGDGIADLIWENPSGWITVWCMNSNCTQRTGYSLGNLGVWKLKGAADINGDGKADLFFQSPMGDVVVWMSQAGGGYQGLGVGNLGAWELRTVADVDGDGVADLIWENPGGWVVVWYLNANGTLRNSAGLGNVGTAKIMAVQ